MNDASVQKLTPFRWTGKRDEAALLVADDALTDEQIASRAGITRQQLVKWKKHPDFQARVTALHAELRTAILQRGIADKVNRIRVLDERWQKMHQVIRERSTDSDYATVAGGTTGLLVHTVKQVGQGQGSQIVDLYDVDTGLLKELRAHEEQAAKEMGQWVERVDAQIQQQIKTYIGVSPDEWAEKVIHASND